MNRTQRKKQARRQHKRWVAATGAQVLTPAEFKTLKAAEGLHVLGVMGYAGAWRDAALEARAKAVLRGIFQNAQAIHGEALVISSGATFAGVLAVTYTLCAELGIKSMGVTPAQALSYPLARLAYLVPVGKRFGDESEAFIHSADQFVLVGGGDQSEAEARRILALGLPLTIAEGFGGAGEVLRAESGSQEPS